ncbi:VOC family protein [Glutamicibacter arilaitensis]|uniref:VOC family protein n=1 Tax=Glutamicibacter arilaitensis TaxID=256701 RepID=UPI003F9CF1FC
MANISINFVPLSVLDVDQALLFYRDGLGFTVVSDVANGDFRWVSLAGSDGSGTNLVLSTPGGRTVRSRCAGPGRVGRQGRYRSTGAFHHGSGRAL